MTQCQHCNTNLTNGRTLCPKATETLTWAITNTGAYYADLNRIRPGVKIHVRQIPHSQPPSSLSPRMVDRIGDALEQTEQLYADTIALLRQHGAKIHIPTDPNHPTGFNITASTVAIETHTTRIATLEDAADRYRTWIRQERTLKALIERTDTGWYAGICNAPLGHHQLEDEHGTLITEPTYCQRGLYATTSSTWITCPTCGASFNINDRRDTMQREAHDTLAPLSTIAAFVVCLDPNETSVEKMNKRLRNWVDRGKLTDYGVRVIKHSDKPTRVYRIGDVLQLIAG